MHIRLQVATGREAPWYPWNPQAAKHRSVCFALVLDEVLVAWHGPVIEDHAVVITVQDPFCSDQVVVQELRVRIDATNRFEKVHHFGVGNRLP